MVIEKVLRDWKPVRDFFVESPERPTYAEVAEKFSIPHGSVSVAAADQGWPLIRARRMELALAEADVAGVLVSAAKSETLIADKARNLVVVMISGTVADIEEIDGSKLKPARKLALRQTASFTLLNLCQALKALGLTGMPKELQERLAAQDANGSNWRSGMAQLNVLIQNAPGGSVSVSKAEKPVETDQTVKNANA